MTASASSDPHPPRHPVLIGLDWGTSSLRAYLFDAYEMEYQ